MPLRFGGDMDDPNNPASPFMKREDVEDVAAEELGISAEGHRTPGVEPVPLEDAVVDPSTGNVSITREEGLDMLCQGLLAQIKIAVADLKAAREGNFWGDVQKVEQNLTMLVPESMQEG